MPYRTCPECQCGLSGVEGHGNIVLEPATLFSGIAQRGGAHFRCLTCGTRWKRSYDGEGKFLWVPSEPQLDGDPS